MSTPAATQVGVVNTRQQLVDTEHGVLKVMVSWPLGWSEDGSTDEDMSDIPVIFILDGNAYFLTATDIVRRQQFVFKKKAVVVGIGYPDNDAVYVVPRRSFDLTPPSKRGLPKWPVKDANGDEEKDDRGEPKLWKLGGAAHLHKAIVEVVIPAVARDILPALPLDRMRKVLFGHSFGGLFTLFSLFTHPGVFDVYIAGSPSIWFNDGALVEEQEKAFLESESESSEGEGAGGSPSEKKRPTLYINSGTAEEDDIFRKPGEADEKFEERVTNSKKYRINGHARDMADRLRASGKLQEVWLQEFALEDHGSAAVVGLQRGINKLLNEWWEGK